GLRHGVRIEHVRHGEILVSSPGSSRPRFCYGAVPRWGRRRIRGPHGAGAGGPSTGPATPRGHAAGSSPPPRSPRRPGGASAAGAPRRPGRKCGAGSACRPRLQTSIGLVVNPLHNLDLARLRRRTSMKWRSNPEDVLPMWVAEMDCDLASPVAEALRDAIALGDTGYACGTSYAEALAAFASQRWGWDFDRAHTSL